MQRMIKCSCSSVESEKSVVLIMQEHFRITAQQVLEINYLFYKTNASSEDPPK